MSLSSAHKRLACKRLVAGFGVEDIAVELAKRDGGSTEIIRDRATHILPDVRSYVAQVRQDASMGETSQ
jgi:hypothetical protein